jgi:hypothetical protein
MEEECQVRPRDTARHHSSNTHLSRHSTHKMVTVMKNTITKPMTRIMIKGINLRMVLGEEGGMVTHRRIRIIHHNRNTMKMTEEYHQGEIVEDHLSKGLHQEEGEDMAGKVEDTQMVLLWAEGADHQGQKEHHLLIQGVSNIFCKYSDVDC